MHSRFLENKSNNCEMNYSNEVWQGRAGASVSRLNHSLYAITRRCLNCIVKAALIDVEEALKFT